MDAVTAKYFKEGVTPVGLHWTMHRAISIAVLVWAQFGKDLVVTSTTDGAHGPLSLHYFGCAIDLRTRYFDPDIVSMVARRLQDQLGLLPWDGYQVVVHHTHIHLEWDYKHCHFLQGE